MCSLLAIKTAKCIPITLYGETNRNYQRKVGYETQKMNEQHSIWRKWTTFQKICFCKFFTLLGTKTPKCMRTHFFIEKLITFQYFSAVYAQNARKNGKQSILEYKRKLPKTCLLRTFDLTYHNAKTHAKYPLWRNINRIKQN